MEINYMKENLKKVNLMVKEQDIMKMEIKDMKEIGKKVKGMVKEQNIMEI